MWCAEFGMGWWDFPVECGNSIDVRDSTGPSASRFQASWLVLSRFWPRYQVDTYVYTLLLVRTWTHQGAGSWGKLFPTSPYHLSWQLSIALSLVYVPSGDNLMDAPPPGGGALRQYSAHCSFVFRISSKREPSLHRFIGLGLTPLLMLKAAAWHFSPGLPKSPPELIFFQGLSILWKSPSKSFHLWL